MNLPLRPNGIHSLFSFCAVFRRCLLLIAAFVPLLTLKAQINYATPYTFTTFAGSSSAGAVDGTGSSARFYGPASVAVNSSGTIYVADSGNSTIRRISPGGIVTTLAGLAGSPGSVDGTGTAARFNRPIGVAVDSAGNIYVAEYGNHTIRKITSAGVVTTIAGTAGAPGSTDGTGAAARFAFPQGVAVDSSGNVYVTDSYNATIRKISPAGMVTTLAGTPGSLGGPAVDGTGGGAQFHFPYGIAADSAGNVYVGDSQNNSIRKITAAGVVTTLAGNSSWGSADGTGSAARFVLPQGVAVDGAGNVYVADTGNYTIRKITSAGVVTTIAGFPRSSGSVDGSGSAARFGLPAGVAVDSAGNVYVADSNGNTVRKITTGGAVTTLAGSPPDAGVDGPSSVAQFYSPQGVAVDGTGNVFVADTYDYTIRKIAASGTVATLAGLKGISGSTDGTGSSSRFGLPQGIAVDGSGNLYVADGVTIRKVTSAGVVTTFAGSAGSSGSTDGTGSGAKFNNPSGVAVDPAGNVYVADTNNQTIRKITAEGVVTTLAGSAGSLGSLDGTGSAARFGYPAGITVDAAGNVFVAESLNNRIRKISAAGVVTTVAGGPAGSPSAVDGPGTTAYFYAPHGLAVDAHGNLFVADTSNSSIRKISSGQVVTTIGGSGEGMYSGSTDGTGGEARFRYPYGVAVDAAGNVYVADTNNHIIRKGVPPASFAPQISTQPLSQTVNAGSSVTFTVVANGLPDPIYQWQKNSVAIDGATTGSYSIVTAAVADAGNYTVLVSNSAGSVTSNLAALTVNLAPTISTQPLDQAVIAGNSVTFTVAASGSPAPAYQWKKEGVAISGATGSSYTIAATLASDAGVYTVVVSNSAGSATSNIATLIVNVPPVVTTQPVSQAITTGSSVTFTVSASGSPAPTYQWQKNGVAISSATNSSYTIGSTVLGDVGSYTAVAANAAGSATSNAAILNVGIPPAGFDVAGYLVRYPAVAAVYGSNPYGAWLHYHDVGIYDGEVFDELFRVEEYLALYPDLFAIFGSDLGSALDHWLSTGRIEGKLGRIPLEFKAQGYFSRNPDVATAVGSDPILAWGHYWLYGIYEGRAYDDELRVFEYLAINADLTAAFVNDWRQAALHWMRYGRTEGRLGRLPLTFNVTEYLVRSPDVAAVWGTNPTTVFLHFWAYGIDEGRTYDDIFRPVEYLALNPDLAAALGTDRRLAFKHWVRYGQTEGRPGRNP